MPKNTHYIINPIIKSTGIVSIVTQQILQFHGMSTDNIGSMFPILFACCLLFLAKNLTEFVSQVKTVNFF